MELFFLSLNKSNNVQALSILEIERICEWNV